MADLNKTYNRKGYSIDFKMFLEGVEVPFRSANVVCTPNGVEASITVYANAELLKLKPKTAVQIFYKDWLKVVDPGWRMLFDGFFSSFQKMDQATQGMEMILLCRDFRMDMRKAPAALSAIWPDELTGQRYLNANGIYQTFVIPGHGSKQTGTRTYDFQGLSNLPNVMLQIAGSAGAKGYTAPQKSQSAFKELGDATSDGRFFLDAFIRGMWSEAVGGTSVGEYLNKRLRIDKRIVVPMNASGYRTWFKASFGLEVGSYMMGDSRFSSLEAVVMRCAGLFMARVYSCNTPMAIPLGNTYINGTGDEVQINEALQYIIDPNVHKFLVKDHADTFGGAYCLNETMLLPPFEFTAPPACNMFFPPVCDRIVFNMDYDSDYTRGYFDVHDSWSTSTAGDLNKYMIQVPNALFTLYQAATKKMAKISGSSGVLGKDQYGRVKPPLTEEERYKGVSTFHGSVEYNLAASDACATITKEMFNKDVVKQIEQERQELIKERNDIQSDTSSVNQLDKVSASKRTQLLAKVDALEKTKKAAKGGEGDERVQTAMRRHAIIMYLNARFGGRVFTVDMMFNPYPMCGFPGAIVFDNDAYGSVTGSSVLGMVQQVKHLITIANAGVELSTTVVMSHCHFVDEPTDIDRFGQAIYMKDTDMKASEIDPDTYMYVDEQLPNKYHFPHFGRPHFVIDPDNNKIDLKEEIGTQDYVYVKDVLTLSAEQAGAGVRNRLYLDQIYEPNRIAKFYKDVFGMPNNMMVGHVMLGMQKKAFMYDSMHEAITALCRDNKELLKDYEAAMNYVRRPVCSANRFYQGVLGLSVKDYYRDKKGNKTYGPDQLPSSKLEPAFVCNVDDPVDDRIFPEYFGITTADFFNGKANDVKKSKGGTIEHAGDLSSIKEHTPLTAFIHERKMAVKAYLTQVMARVEAVHYE